MILPAGFARGIRKRLALLLGFATLANLISYTAALGISGPVMGFYSWAFLLIRRSGANLAGAIFIYLAYLLGLFILTTFLALLNRGRALIVPILIHSLGSIVAAVTFGPLMADETWGTFLLYLLLSMMFSIFWIFVDWRLAYSSNKIVIASEASS